MEADVGDGTVGHDQGQQARWCQSSEVGLRLTPPSGLAPARLTPERARGVARRGVSSQLVIRQKDADLTSVQREAIEGA